MVMNMVFKPEQIVPILADVGVSVSDLKKNPTAVIEAARHTQVAILNRNKAVAYLVSPQIWESLLVMLEDYEDGRIVEDRLANPEPRIRVEINDLV